MSFIVAGIGTDVGKTVISAILCQAFGAEYWKPIQAGDLDNSDTDKVRRLVTNRSFKAHREAYRLNKPMSPHAAAKLDKLKIRRNNIERPNTEDRPLVTELAGGLMVPLSENYLTIDLAEDVGDPLIIVVNSYLGSINHTLLTLNLVAQRGHALAGLIFNGETNPESQDVILKYSGVPHIADIPKADFLTQSFVKTHADKIRNESGLVSV